MKVSERITSSSALIDFSRPTKSGTIMCGNTTMSRRGRTGYARVSPGCSWGRGLLVIAVVLLLCPCQTTRPCGIARQCLQGGQGAAGRPGMLAGRVRTLAPFGNQIRSLVRQLFSHAIRMGRHIGPQEASDAVKASPLPVTTPQFVRIGSLFPDFFLIRRKAHQALALPDSAVRSLRSA